MRHDQQSEPGTSPSTMESTPAFSRRRESKNPASEVRRLLIAAARALPAGIPLWVNKSAVERSR